MKSAYEIAMERMKAESGESRQLSDEEKARIADIDNMYDAKIAEINVTFEGKIAGAPDPGTAAALQDEQRAEVARLEEKRQYEKDAIWNQAD